ncbi:hypothetical protein [Nocardioides euryhalodurans]|uniref:Choice-of-anchor D domain-containing protein n=1 Tax=Nocardioides euryhalodurans TaxID=2518370 RepID=A0A4P7GN99_9ACTN|nr:hypothetical protein [Nocardioides euryhalodurans]QBR93668.1 hypothetical protein EXE57_16335 [Nocardioides euryhalodurans]
MEMAKHGRLGRLTILLLALVAGLVTLAPPASAAPEQKVTICHRTTSPTNPYDQIAVAQSAALNAHAGHTGPIFTVGADNWGDIIPPIPGLPGGLNWPEGRSVLENGCEVEPDVGPLPSATIGDVECAGTLPTLTITVSNAPDATQPAFFAIGVDGSVVRRVGPVAPGASETVVLGPALATREDQTFAVTVRSGGEIVASKVVTVHCEAGPPDVELTAQLGCSGATAQGTVTLTNNGTEPVEVTATVDGTPVGAPVTVAPGATETGAADLSAYEDQTVTAVILVDGVEVARFVISPDCVAPEPAPRVGIAGAVCPPPSTTLTLANDGDPGSTVVFTIRIDGRVVQRSAPIHGGEETTIVGDLTAFEDQTVVVELLADDRVLGRRTFDVDCVAVAPGTGTTSPSVPTVVPAGVEPASADDQSPRGLLVVGPVLLGSLLGALLVCRDRSRRLVP